MIPEETAALLAEAAAVSGIVDLPVDQLDELGLWAAAVDGFEVDEIGVGDPIAPHHDL